MTKYTADDFANAKFAERENVGTARSFPQITGGGRWAYGGAFLLSDEQMADEGWVPVIPARIIHDRDVEALCIDKASYERDDYLDGFMRGFQQAGGVILDDPEPTNTERLRDALASEGVYVSERIAERLDEAGITAPNMKDN